MASVYGSNYNASYVSVPRGRPNVGEQFGKVRVIYDEITGGVAADSAYFGKIPKGARVLSVTTIGAGTGASVNVNPADLISAETDLIITLGTGPSATVKAFVLYTIE